MEEKSISVVSCDHLKKKIGVFWHMCKIKKNVEELCERFIRLFEPSVMDGADTKNLIQQDSDILHLIFNDLLSP